MPARWRCSARAASRRRSATPACRPSAPGLIVWTEDPGRRGDRAPRARPRDAQNMAVTPVRNCLCAQDYLEPVLRRFAERQAPGELRFNAELTAFEQDARGVTATLTRPRDRRRGRRSRAQYMIAADGAQSPMRRVLGVHDDRPGGRLRQRQHPVQRRPAAVDGASAGRALLRRERAAARHVPHHQRARPLGLPGALAQGATATRRRISRPSARPS